MSLASQGSLPRGTRDTDQARGDLAEFGCCLAEDALSPALVESLRVRLLEQAAAEETAGVGCFDQGPEQLTSTADGRFDRTATLPGRGGVNQRVQTLLNKGQVCCDLVMSPVILDIVSYWLGESFLEVRENASPKLLRLLGFEPWERYGRWRPRRSQFLSSSQGGRALSVK
jgi:hypothetical protein